MTFVGRAPGLGDLARPGRAVRRAVRRQLEPCRPGTSPARPGRHVTVALTGDAGDELFAGYDRYRAVALADRCSTTSPTASRGFLGGPVARALPASVRAKTRLRQVRRMLEGIGQGPRGPLPPLGRDVRRSRRGLPSIRDDFLDRLGQAAASDAPEEADPASILARAFAAAPKRDPVTRATIVDLLHLLARATSWSRSTSPAWASSLECRSPFLDHRVVELALAMPDPPEAPAPRRPVQGRSSSRPSPTSSPPRSADRPKMGFGVPLDRWFRGELKDELRSVLLDPRALGRGLFRPIAVENLIEEHLGSKRDHAYKLWTLLMLELWSRHHMDR